MANDRNQIWRRILEHPEGPSEFPVEQIVTFRWYRPELCPVEGVYFPQLQGKKVREYRCPDCKRPAFIDVEGEVAGGVTSLAQHLRIMHGWDRPSIMIYGEHVGIDFQKIDALGALGSEYDPSDQPPPRNKGGRPRKVLEPQVEIDMVGAP